MREIESEGHGKDRADCMKRFKAAWIKFAADEANLAQCQAESRKAPRVLTDFLLAGRMLKSGLVEGEPVAHSVTHAVSASAWDDSKPPFDRTREYHVRCDRDPESVRADKWDKNEDADDRSDRHYKRDQEPNMKAHGKPTASPQRLRRCHKLVSNSSPMKAIGHMPASAPCLTDGIGGHGFEAQRARLSRRTIADSQVLAFLAPAQVAVHLRHLRQSSR
jgi:hypothetical protein